MLLKDELDRITRVRYVNLAYEGLIVKEDIE